MPCGRDWPAWTVTEEPYAELPRNGHLQRGHFDYVKPAFLLLCDCHHDGIMD